MAQPIPAWQAHSPEDYALLGIRPDVIEGWEDGIRSGDAKGDYDWWYFDSQLEDGSALVVVFFSKIFFGLQAGFHPQILFQLTRPDGSVVRRMARQADVPYSFSKEGCDVVIGNSFFRGDLREYHIHVDVEGILADIHLSATVPSLRPKAGHLLFGEGGTHRFGWLPSVPYGDVTATLTLEGETQTLTGHGYHDHNWGDVALTRVMHHWYWGRAKVGPYMVIVSYMTVQEAYGYREFPVFMLAKDGEVVSIDEASELQFSAGERYTDEKTGIPVDARLVFDLRKGNDRYVVTFEEEKTIDATAFAGGLTGAKKLAAKAAGLADASYLRFLGRVSVEQTRGGSPVDSASEEGLWELMYLGKIL